MLSFTFIVFSVLICSAIVNYSIGLQRLKPVHTPFKLTRFIVDCTIWPKIGLGHET